LNCGCVATVDVFLQLLWKMSVQIAAVRGAVGSHSDDWTSRGKHSFYEGHS